MTFDPLEELRADLQQEPPQRSMPWLMTFTDVTALLLTFFVMIFAMSTIPSERWDAVVSMLSTRDRDNPTTEPVARSVRNVDTVAEKPALALTYLSRLLSEHVADAPALEGARITELDGALALSFPGETQFVAGRARLDTGFADVLESLAGVLDRFGNVIHVVGHAAPPDGEGQANGAASEAQQGRVLRLSLARAQAVADALSKAGYGAPVRVLAHGATQFGQLAPTAPPARRLALARRVDIVIHDRTGG